jgi:HPt (histidine-containing phosphotransfer) domain-containing protein
MPDSAVEFAPGSAEKVIVHVDASFEPLIPKFLANRKAETVTLRDALAAKDFDTVRKVSHSMKGVGGSYGFDRISEIASAMEEAAKAADASIIERELPALCAYLARVEVVYDAD